MSQLAQILFCVFILIAVSLLGCKKVKKIDGCTDQSAYNYDPNATINVPSSCEYSGNAIFYIDAGMPSYMSINVTLANQPQSQGQTILYSYPYGGSPPCNNGGCANFSQDFNDSNSINVSYTATLIPSPLSWNGVVTFKANNQCTPVLLPAGNVYFYTTNSSYFSTITNSYIAVSVTNCYTENIQYACPSSQDCSTNLSTCAFFMLPLGNYTYTAYNQEPNGSNPPIVLKTWTGSFSVNVDKELTGIQLQ